MPLPAKPPGDPRPWQGGRIAAYHITHVGNLESIAQCGEIRCDRECSHMDQSPASIAYSDLKQRRAGWRVEVGPRGTLADYVPFYYAPRSPMLFVNFRGGVATNTTGQNEIIHLVVDVDAVAKSGNYVITDGHAATPLTSQFDEKEGLKEIDWSIMEARYWSDTDEDGDRKRRRQAELLVHERVPFSAICLIGVIDAEAEERVSTALEGATEAPPVRIRRDWYY